MISELQSPTDAYRGEERLTHRAACRAAQRGQSLVETALIMPVLLLMFLGVLEVGWVLRGYLVLVNADREAARFAARGPYLDFSQPNIGDVGYDTVLAHTIDSISGQLPIVFTSSVTTTTQNATMIITHMDIDTGYPCAEDQRPCNDECSANPNATFPGDDKIGLPPPIGEGYGDPSVVISDTFRIQYGMGGEEYATRIDDTLWQELRDENEALNCQLMAKDPDLAPSANSVIIVEMYYNQPQLLGLPLISNLYTDPVRLYTHTMMRIASIRRR